MNGDSRSSRDRPITLRPKGNLLSTYLISDEEDEEDEATLEHLTIETADAAGYDDDASQRLEVLASSGPNSSTSTHNTRTSIHTLLSPSSVHTFDSTGCEPSLTSERPGLHSSDHSVPPKLTNLWNDDTIDSCTPLRSQYRVTFEIIRAKTITAIEKGIGRNRFEKRRYVSYTVLIKRVPGLETQPAVIERRYSDFLNFYNSIKKKYSGLLHEVVFPKKILIGNFSPDVIAARSVAFQNFLTYCLSISEIRSSKEFAAFLYYPELKEAKRCLQSIHLEDAGNILENVYFIQDKLAIHSGRASPQLVHTLCCLIGCLNAVDNTAEAKKLAAKAFEILFENAVVLTPSSSQNVSVYEVNNLYESCDLVLPLILLSLRLRWFSGKHKLQLESKLEELCRKRSLPRHFDSQPTLLEIILRKDFSLILE